MVGIARAMCLHLAILASIFVVNSFAELQGFRHLPKRDGSLSFLVVGDWGRRGFYNQSEVGRQMGRIGEKLDIDFVVSTGDNIYDNGLKGILDPAFVECFTKVYTAKSLQTQWYSVLGNHDYRGNVEAQLSPVLRKIDSRWLCLRSYVVNAGLAEFFYVDTTPFVDKYFKDPYHNYDWSGVLPREVYITNLLEDLEANLAISTAKWKIVVGHHAIRSIGHHGDTPELINLFLPILKANNVDLYINGHDHCLEHIASHDSPLQYLTSGAGSKAWRGDMKRNYDLNAMKFFYDGQGFMSVQLNETDAQVVFYNIFGSVIHKWKVSKNLFSAM